MVQLFVSKILMILGLSDLPPILLILLAIESYLLSLLFFFLMVYRYRKHRRLGRRSFFGLQLLCIGVYAMSLFSLTVLFTGLGFFLTPVVTAFFCGLEAILITGRALNLQSYSRLPIVVGIFGCGVLPWFLVSLAYPITGVIFIANGLLVGLFMLYMIFVPGKKLRL
ncbi:MAG: hypothetical protein ORO03_02620 [Alphaproteobacteria bacterium]|nr:hypothetical protein [Alphaproteobacteria bacterium]